MSAERFLQPLRDEVIFIQEDALAKELAVFFGVAANFVPPEDKEWIQVEFYENHPSHWVAFQRFTGFSDDRENGWSVLFSPKSADSFDAFRRQFLERLKPDWKSRGERFFP